MNTPHIFDSHALLKLFQREKGWEKVAEILNNMEKPGGRSFLNVINLGEIIYITKREFGDMKKVEVLANIERMGIIVLPIPNDLVFEAAELKAKLSISFADCFTITSALRQKATIVTGDPEFKKAEDLVQIEWV